MDPESNEEHDRKIVVEAFLESCPDPEPKDVEKWCRAHPRHRDAIVATATELIEIALLAERARNEEVEGATAPLARAASRRPRDRSSRLRGRDRDGEVD